MADPMTILALARDNKAAEIRQAVAAGVPPGICNQMGQTGLHIAALWGNIDAMKVLLELGVPADIENARGTTPLHFAANAKQNALEACQLLLSHGAPTDTIDASGRRPYEMADDDEVRKLLGGPDPRLFKCCEKGKVDELQELLSSGTVASVRLVDSEGRTPLNLAISSENLDTIKALLKFDPMAIRYTDLMGDTALHVAAELGNLDILRFLLSQDPGPDVNYQSMNSSEYASGNWSLHGETLMPLDKAPLHLAVEAGDLETAALLIEHGADVNLLDFDKTSPLHSALEMLDFDMVKLLLKSGADVHLANKDFGQPIHLAASRGPIKLLKLLLDKGVDINAVTQDGWRPLQIAARIGNAEKVKLLLEAGAEVNAPDNKLGNTALHLAAINGHAEVCKLLLDKAADRSIKNSSGKTAAEVAKTPEVAQLLTS